MGLDNPVDVITLECVGPWQVSRWLSDRLEEREPDMGLLIVLFGGDRLYCCDEAVVARDAEGQIVGLVTLAPQGEMGEGPALVGLYVKRAWRRQGVGTQLVTRAVQRMRERGLVPVRLNVLSMGLGRLVDALPQTAREDLIVHRQSTLLDWLGGNDESAISG